MGNAGQVEVSDKSYTTAVVLSMIFGMLGIHHFYLGNWVHGLFDLGLFIGGFGLVLFSGDPMLVLVRFGLIGIDFLHTLIVTIMLFVGSVKDRNGRVVAYPGQYR